ncbi:hypothetical protein OKW35_001248 [Paraburkholderia sp. MM5477-R1]
MSSPRGARVGCESLTLGAFALRRHSGHGMAGISATPAGVDSFGPKPQPGRGPQRPPRYAGVGLSGSPHGSELIRFTSRDSSQFGVRAQYSTIGSASSPQNS